MKRMLAMLLAMLILSSAFCALVSCKKEEDAPLSSPSAKIDVLKIGKPFEGDLGTDCPYAAEVFTLSHEGKTYVAVFNYSQIAVKTYNVDVPANATAVNLFTGKTKNIGNGGAMLVTLQPGDSVIFEITK